VPGLAQLEVPDLAHKQIADSKVEEAPQDIDCRGRQPYPGRGREGTLEGMARDPIAEMRQRVREEGAPEEIRQIVVPAHDSLHFGLLRHSLNILSAKAIESRLSLANPKRTTIETGIDFPGNRPQYIH